MTEAAVNLTRRQFGKSVGSFVLAFSLAPRLAGAQTPKLPGSLANNPMLDAWLRINADGSATIFTGKVELGQGISTALVQIAADELDLPLARVEMISGDTAQTPDEAIPPAASRSRTAAPRSGSPARRRAPCWSTTPPSVSVCPRKRSP